MGGTDRPLPAVGIPGLLGKPSSLLVGSFWVDLISVLVVDFGDHPLPWPRASEVIIRGPSVTVAGAVRFVQVEEVAVGPTVVSGWHIGDRGRC